jgi:hypothetical protein
MEELPNELKGPDVDAAIKELEDFARRPMAFAIEYKSDSSVDEAIEIIKAHLDSGKSFTNAQIDICTQVLATQLPSSEKDMLAEIAEQNEYPLWVGLLAQWRRCVEYGEAYAVLIDPDWQKKIDERKEEVNGAVVVVDDNGKTDG